MYKASLAAVLGLGTLLMFTPAQSAPPQNSGVVLAQWGWGAPPPQAWGGRGYCRQLQHQLNRLYAMRAAAPPWERRGIQPGIRETRAQLRYYCPGW